VTAPERSRVFMTLMMHLIGVRSLSPASSRYIPDVGRQQHARLRVIRFCREG
jgi:hypothetical protein